MTDKSFIALVKLGLEDFLTEPNKDEKPVIILDPNVWERMSIKSEQGTLEISWRNKEIKDDGGELTLSLSLSWRESEGLEVSAPYVEDVLGHTHIVRVNDEGAK